MAETTPDTAGTGAPIAALCDDQSVDRPDVRCGLAPGHDGWHEAYAEPGMNYRWPDNLTEKRLTILHLMGRL